MSQRAMSIEQYYLPNTWVPFTMAFAFHIFLLAWDPTILKASPYNLPAQVINVRMMDHLPVMEPVKPKPVLKPVEKKIERHHEKKAKKSGLSLSAKSHPVAVAQHKITAHPHATAPKPFVSKITMPKFVPHEMDEPIAASPLPGITAASPHKSIQAYKPAPVFKGKTRGVRASDIPFQLTDRGSVGSVAGRIIAVPIGEERGEIAVLPNAPTIHEAPKGIHAVAGYKFSPGLGSGSGELSGHSKTAYIGYHGVAKSDDYVEGSLNGTSGSSRGGKVVAGKGFEIGGPVGDRHITHRRLPEYPAWAEEKGISAMVKIYFTVKSDGSIRQYMRIVTSSGYAELDDLAKEALMQWRFSPTSADSNEQTAWGVITFRFTLG